MPYTHTHTTTTTTYVSGLQTSSAVHAKVKVN